MITPNHWYRIRVLAVVLVAFFVWTEQVIAQAGATAEAGVRAQIAALEAALDAQDPAGYSALYAPDATFIAGDGPRTEGRDIRTWLRNTGYEVIEIPYSDLFDRGAMTNHMRRLAGHLREDEVRAYVREDPAWYDAAQGVDEEDAK